MSSTNNVTSLADYRKEFEDFLETEGPMSGFPGFSSRLNNLIDFAEIDVPSVGSRGRATELAAIFGVTYVSVGAWIKDDKAPREDVLRNIVTFLISKTNIGCHSMKVVAWLLYGEDVIKNPILDSEIKQQGLIALASVLVNKVSNQREIGTATIDLGECIRCVAELLAQNNVIKEENVTPGQLDSIELAIRRNLKQV
jgi:hypothetical protein